MYNENITQFICLIPTSLLYMKLSTNCRSLNFIPCRKLSVGLSFGQTTRCCIMLYKNHLKVEEWVLMVVFDKEVVKEGGAGGENHLEVGKKQIHKYSLAI